MAGDEIVRDETAGSRDERPGKDITDPLYVHPGDGPGLILVSQQFDGRNFSGWKRSMRIGLSAKNKWCIVNGTYKKPKSDSLSYPVWERVNDMVISWIVNGLSSEIRNSVIFNDTAEGIWKELEARFGQTSGAQLYSIQKELLSLTQGSMSITSYFTKIKSLWDELSSQHKFPNCSCGAVSQIQKYEEEQKLVQLLMGLNESYNITRGNLLMRKPLPSLDEAYSTLLQEETQREIKNNSSVANESASFYVDSKKIHSSSEQAQGKKTGFYCTNCKKKNHNVDKCYFIIGFPKDYRSKKATANSSESHEEAGSSSGSKYKALELTAVQYNQLIQLLQSKENKVTELGRDFAGFAGWENEEAYDPW